MGKTSRGRVGRQPCAWCSRAPSRSRRSRAAGRRRAPARPRCPSRRPRADYATVGRKAPIPAPCLRGRLCVMRLGVETTAASDPAAAPRTSSSRSSSPTTAAAATTTRSWPPSSSASTLATTIDLFEAKPSGADGPAGWLLRCGALGAAWAAAWRCKRAAISASRGRSVSLAMHHQGLDVARVALHAPQPVDWSEVEHHPQEREIHALLVMAKPGLGLGRGCGRSPGVGQCGRRGDRDRDGHATYHGSIDGDGQAGSGGGGAGES